MPKSDQIEGLIERLADPHKVLVRSDREEAAAMIRALDAALEEARHWIVCSGARHPGGVLAIIDKARFDQSAAVSR